MANTATNPVPITGAVQNAENHARSAVQQEIDVIAPQGETVGFGFVTVPAGKIFVLEVASFFAESPGATVVSLSISVVGPHIDGSNGTTEYFLVIPPPTNTGFTCWQSGTASVRATIVKII